MKRLLVVVLILASLSCSSAAKPVYIISDNINNVEVDNQRIDFLVSELNKTGVSAYNCGVGTNNIDIFDSIPGDCVLIEIVGGSDASMIWEMGTDWYRGVRGNRTVFMIFVPPAVDIAGLEYLERAHDDNFSPGDFYGLEKPAEYLKNNGYSYSYWTNNTNDVIDSIKKAV